MTDNRRDNIIQRRKVTDDPDGRLHMTFHDLILFIRKLAFLVQDMLRDPDLSNIMKKRRLTDDLHHFRCIVQRLRKTCCVISHIVGMSEGIMIFGINGCSQRIDRGFIGLINMFMIGFLTRIFFIQAFLQHGVKNLDAIFTAALYMIYCQVRIIQELLC